MTRLTGMINFGATFAGNQTSTKNNTNPMKYFLTITFCLFIYAGVKAQVELPVDTSTGLITYQGVKNYPKKSQKKLMKAFQDWQATYDDFPRMNWLDIRFSEDSVIMMNMIQIASVKHLHDLHFNMELHIEKKRITYRVDDFFFNDIGLSLDDWLNKYKGSDNPRHQQNYKRLTEAVDSCISLLIKSMNDHIKK